MWLLVSLVGVTVAASVSGAEPANDGPPKSPEDGAVLALPHGVTEPAAQQQHPTSLQQVSGEGSMIAQNLLVGVPDEDDNSEKVTAGLIQHVSDLRDQISKSEDHAKATEDSAKAYVEHVVEVRKSLKEITKVAEQFKEKNEEDAKEVYKVIENILHNHRNTEQLESLTRVGAPGSALSERNTSTTHKSKKESALEKSTSAKKKSKTSIDKESPKHQGKKGTGNLEVDQRPIDTKSRYTEVVDAFDEKNREHSESVYKAVSSILDGQSTKQDGLSGGVLEPKTEAVKRLANSSEVGQDVDTNNPTKAVPHDADVINQLRSEAKARDAEIAHLREALQQQWAQLKDLSAHSVTPAHLPEESPISGDPISGDRLSNFLNKIG